MMTEKYPTWLIGHVKEWAEKRLPTVILCSTTGNELLEVWYYGDLLTVKGEPQSYIIDSDEAPGLVTARDPESGEEFVIFDGGRHGYDNMFCDEHDPSELEHRPLKRYEIPASKLVLELGYSVDYEDEKEDFEPDEADTVELINGERMPWEQVKRDGIDYIALYYVNEKGSVPFPVSWTVKMKKKQKETQDILSYHSQAAGCSDKARAKASGGRQPIEECGRTGL